MFLVLSGRLRNNIREFIGKKIYPAETLEIGSKNLEIPGPADRRLHGLHHFSVLLRRGKSEKSYLLEFWKYLRSLSSPWNFILI